MTNQTINQQKIILTQGYTLTTTRTPKGQIQAIAENILVKIEGLPADCLEAAIDNCFSLVPPMLPGMEVVG